MPSSRTFNFMQDSCNSISNLWHLSFSCAICSRTFCLKGVKEAPYTLSFEMPSSYLPSTVASDERIPVLIKQSWSYSVNSEAPIRDNSMHDEELVKAVRKLNVVVI